MFPTFNNYINFINTSQGFLNYTDPNDPYGYKHTYCSEYIQKQGIIVMGENQKSRQESRGALLKLMDPVSGRAVGESNWANGL